MAPRTYKEKKLLRQKAVSAILSPPQTRSAAPKSLSRFGFYGSHQPDDEATDAIRNGNAVRARRPIKVSLAPMPWDEK